jgi:hypothetical protein
MTRSIPRIGHEEVQKLCVLAGEPPETLIRSAPVAFYRTSTGDIVARSDGSKPVGARNSATLCDLGVFV